MFCSTISIKFDLKPRRILSKSPAKSEYPQNRPRASAPHKSLISRPIYLKFCVSIIQSFGNKHTKIQWVWCKNDGFRTVNLGPVFFYTPYMKFEDKTLISHYYATLEADLL